MTYRKFLSRPLVKGFLKVFLILCVIILVALGSGLLFIVVKINQTVTLPAPTGPYAVGRVSYDWIDQAREDSFAPRKGVKRELLVWVWYPAEHVAGAQPGPYLPAKWGQEWNALHGPLFQQRANSIRIHAIDAAPIATAQKQYPVLLFEPGLGLIPTDYTTLIEDIVSHGYIVVGITPTYTSSVVVFPDGRVVPSTPAGKGNINDNAPEAVVEKAATHLSEVLSQDEVFVMNRLQTLNADKTGKFAGYFDFSRLGIFGHSLGGNTAMITCKIDARCKAAINLDGGSYATVRDTGLEKPFMGIYHPQASTFNVPVQSLMRANRYLLTIQGIQHFNFADYSVIFAPALYPLGLLGSLNGARGLQITSAYVRAFFDTYVKDAPPSSLLQGPSPTYPEVQFAKP